MNNYTKEDAIMEQLEEKALEEEKTTDLVIYDVPVEVKDKFISLAKLKYDNQGWVALAEAIRALTEMQDKNIEDLEDRVDRLEEEINIMKDLTKYSDEQMNDSESGKPTFGDLQDTDFSEDFKKLQEISQSRGDNNDE